MAKRKKSIKTLKRKVWEIFSKYIRLKHSDKNGYVTCCTCGKAEPWEDVDAGHFISRAYSATFLEETNVHPQCRFENRYRNGAPDEYAMFIIRKYGIDELERLRHLKYSIVKRSIPDWEYLLEKYTNLVDELESKL